jgi:SAM-dependent methyltransferase
LNANGLRTRFGTVAELGPGDSLGLGIAALLSCAKRYVALDTIPYATPDVNLRVLDALVELFQKRSDIPGEEEFPLVFPTLSDYRFPDDILTDKQLKGMLDPARLASIRASLREPCADMRSDELISYVVPWHPADMPAESVDLVVSQTVLQYADDLQSIYGALYQWLRPGGLMSHEVDFKSVGRTRSWNGHWACSDLSWALIQGRRRSPINRAPFSIHVALQRAAGFEIVATQRNFRPSEISRLQLASRFAWVSEQDLMTASALIQSCKPAGMDQNSRSISQ